MTGLAIQMGIANGNGMLKDDFHVEGLPACGGGELLTRRPVVLATAGCEGHSIWGEENQRR
jgi:hypothetical protein